MTTQAPAPSAAFHLAWYLPHIAGVVSGGERVRYLLVPVVLEKQLPELRPTRTAPDRARATITKGTRIGAGGWGMRRPERKRRKEAEAEALLRAAIQETREGAREQVA